VNRAFERAHREAMATTRDQRGMLRLGMSTHHANCISSARCDGGAADTRRSLQRSPTTPYRCALNSNAPTPAAYLVNVVSGVTILLPTCMSIGTSERFVVATVFSAGIGSWRPHFKAITGSADRKTATRDARPCVRSFCV